MSRWISPGRLDNSAERDAQQVQLLEGVLAHHDDDARLHDRELVEHARAALGAESSVSWTGT